MHKGLKSGCFTPRVIFLFALPVVFTWLAQIWVLPFEKRSGVSRGSGLEAGYLQRQALLFPAFYLSRRSCGDSKDMRLSQVCNILCTICYACLFIHGCTAQFDSECWMSSPKNLMGVVGLLWPFLPLRKSPCPDLLIPSLTTLALGTLILYLVLFRKKINFCSLFGLSC